MTPYRRGFNVIRNHIGILVFSAIALFGQAGESTQILGIVEDSTGAVVPGVTITATHVATGQSRRVTTGESGTYVFPFMAPGEYTVRAEKDGFKADSPHRSYPAT